MNINQQVLHVERIDLDLNRVASNPHGNLSICTPSQKHVLPEASGVGRSTVHLGFAGTEGLALALKVCRMSEKALSKL